VTYVPGAGAGDILIRFLGSKGQRSWWHQA